MKKKSRRSPLPAALLCVLVVAAAFFGFRWLTDNRLPNVTAAAEVYVRAGTPLPDVLDQLSGSVRRRGSLERMFRSKKVGQYMQPGHYSFAPGTSSVYVARALNNGWQTPVKLTLSGSLRLPGEIARKISSQMMLDSAEVAAALSDAALLKEFGATPSTVFGILMPDTYELYWTASMEEILRRNKAACDAFWTADNLAKARSQGLSREQAVTLASIVKGESRVQGDFSRIAGVYLNRLHRGMKLQADPTVAYCFDYTLNRILKKHLAVDSPYNTYRYAGLPPGPICVPDRAYLEAVLNPSVSEGYLFFCASPSFDGTHRFARTYAEHQKNAREFQRALSARR